MSSKLTIPACESRPGTIAPQETSSLLRVEEVAVILGISRRTIYRRVSAGELVPPIKIGASTRWCRSDIENWVETLQSERMA